MSTNEGIISTKRHTLPRTSVPSPRSEPWRPSPGGRRRQPRNAPSSGQVLHNRATADVRKHTWHKQHEPRQRAKLIMGAWEPRGRFQVPPPREHFRPCTLAKITKIKNPTINFQPTTHRTGPKRYLLGGICDGTP